MTIYGNKMHNKWNSEFYGKYLSFDVYLDPPNIKILFLTKQYKSQIILVVLVLNFYTFKLFNLVYKTNKTSQQKFEF